MERGVWTKKNKKKTTAYGWHITPTVLQTSAFMLLKIRLVFGIMPV